MSKTLAQIYASNPITINAAADLMYFSQSPYSPGLDAAMTFANFAAQFAEPLPTVVDTSVLCTDSAGNLYWTSMPDTGYFLQSTPNSPQVIQQSQFALPAGALQVNRLLYCETSDLVGMLVTADSGVLITGNTGAPGWLANSSTPGYVLTANSGAPPSWQVSAVTPIAVQYSFFNIGADFGAANTYQITTTPAIVTLDDGLAVRMVATQNANTTTSTLYANGTTQPIVNLHGAALSGGEILAGFDYDFIWNVANSWWVLQNSSLSAGGSSPWTAGTGTNSAIGGDGTAIASGNYSVSYGSNTNKVEGESAASFGNANIVYNNFSFCGGTSNSVGGVAAASFNQGNATNANWAFTCGLNNQNNGGFSFVCGSGNELDSCSGSFIGGSGYRNDGYNYNFGWGDNVGTTNYPTADGQWNINCIGGFKLWQGNGNLQFNLDSSGHTNVIQVGFFNTATGGIRGTITDDSAAAGYVGEFISSVIPLASAVSLTSVTPANVTSISLTAGDWDVEGNVWIVSSAGILATNIWANATSATTPDASLKTGYVNAGAVFADWGATIPKVRFSLASTTTIYLGADIDFIGTATACGGISARRVR